MLNADGVLQGVHFTHKENLEKIWIWPDVKSLIIDQPLDLPSVIIDVAGATTVRINGNAHLTEIVAQRRGGQNNLMVCGDLTAEFISIDGTVHVTGSIEASKEIDADGSIHCNGSIHAKFVTVRKDIFVDDDIIAKEIICQHLTMYSDRPMPKFTVRRKAA